MIRKTVEGREYESQMVGELHFDQTPKEGSFNPVTSDAVVKAIDEAKEDMQEKIDEVTLDPSAVALGNVHLLDEVTEFPADGCILIDSETNGPGEMPKDTLLELTAQNALGSIKNLTTTITDFRTGDVIPVDGPNGPAKMSNDDLMRVINAMKPIDANQLRYSTKVIYGGEKVIIDNGNRKIVFGGNITILAGTAKKILSTTGLEVSFTAVDDSFSGTRQGVLLWNDTTSTAYVKQYDHVNDEEIILMTLYFNDSIGSGTTPSTTRKIVSYSSPLPAEISDKRFATYNEVAAIERKNSYKFVYNGEYVTIDNTTRTISFSGNTVILASPNSPLTISTSGKSTSFTAAGSSFSGTRMGVVVWNTTNSALYVRQYDKVQDDDYVLITLFMSKAVGSGSTPATDTLVTSYSSTLPIKFIPTDGLEPRVEALEKTTTKLLIEKKDEAQGLGSNQFTPYRSIGSLTAGVRYYVYVNNYKHESATSGYLFAVREIGGAVVASTDAGNELKPYYSFVAQENAVYGWGGRCDSDDTMIVEFLPHKKQSIVENSCMPVLSDALVSCSRMSKTASFMYVTDLHGKLASLQLAVDLRRNNFTSVPIICGGDIPSMGPLDSGSADFIDSYIDLCKKSVVYMVLGQHEVGFAPQADPTALRGRQKSLTLSTQQAFDRFFAPLKSSWGLPTLDTCYYYKDFGKVRLITLYQYDRPEVDDPNDSELWKYQRDLLWYGQDQIDWFIDTLNDMASDQIAVILMHQPPTGISKTDNKFGAYDASAPNKIADDPITEIIAAYNARGSLSKTYEPTDPTTYLPSDGFSVTVNEDFSSAVGKVGFTIQGDNHTDSVGKYTGTDVLAVCLTSSGSPSDGVVTTDTGMLSDYIVNAIGVNASNKVIVARCGQQYFMGKVRDTELLSY